ncbi:hypothetical protein [Enterococcus ratti]|uniref:Uncharacterized protein n=1 Tax=Enterococcus ratti TaxID=150033 RepID=A0A1L8WA01_9ENTE|nr:hypothetical protein [Enterococcus ratti]OJG77857.1 hypothetical protein RV14_GL001491 [Enterococcus ratti]
MYITPIFIIVSGILFLISAIYLFLDNYKKMIMRQINQSIIYINTIVLISSIVLIILGVVYFIVIKQQL